MTPSVSDIVRFVSEHGEVIRTARLIEQGFGRRALETAVRAGLLIRPRRGWVAVPAARRMLLSAARFGVVLTCRTRARMLGLWLHDAGGEPHVAVPPNRTGRVGVRAKVHWGEPVVPRHPDALVDPIENVLAYIAECEPFEQALATWESALNLGLVERGVLERLPLRPAARRVLAEASPFADAGLETYLRRRLAWLRLPIRVQIWIHGHRVDALIGDRLVLQIDGKHHVGAQRSEDIRHDAELMLLGYHVIRVSYRQVMFEWHVVQDLIMRAVAQGLHRAA
ncbi:MULTISPECIES: type IV toxin-antitoxin system AbiEi family antitoxin domain-containing protein [Microbacterium]|uniref:type IV toxin-antitoxin system AbiEi family antitoxin domain-containing protein n=1 Tax=Microbacterium TaxID=33882 RepID=UPI00217D9016|nr:MULTISPECIES: type IV toxin-antitoxin system AbiEi family antitoxin domain-containing protein [Microbacterium]UWF76705.1 DUF559 domain-containing protein [Microbacterium neungamense]WCM54855.1 DUF559 domain-containing protein [Microbacterium sp. EF45047]